MNFANIDLTPYIQSILEEPGSKLEDKVARINYLHNAATLAGKLITMTDIDSPNGYLTSEDMAQLAIYATWAYTPIEINEDQRNQIMVMVKALIDYIENLR